MLWGRGLLALCPTASQAVRPTASQASEAAGPGQPPPGASLAASLPARLSGVRRSLSFTRRAPHPPREEGAPAARRSLSFGRRAPPPRAEGGEGGEPAARVRRSLSFTRRAPQARAEGAEAAPPARRSLSFTTADLRRRAFGEREPAPPAPVTPPRPIGLHPVAGRPPPTPEQRARAAADLKAPPLEAGQVLSPEGAAAARRHVARRAASERAEEEAAARASWLDAEEEAEEAEEAVEAVEAEAEEDVPTAAMLAFWNADAAAPPTPQPPPQPQAPPAARRDSPAPGTARGGRPSPPLSLEDISRALPHGWAAVRDESGGRTYYWHEETGATSWVRPVEAEAAAAAAAAEAEAAAGAVAVAAAAAAAAAEAAALIEEPPPPISGG